MKKTVIIIIILSFCSFTFIDAVKEISPHKRGIGSAIKMLTLLKKITTQYRPDKRTKAHQDFIYKQLGNFNFERIYRSKYFTPMPDGYRCVKFRGYETEKYYKVRHTNRPFNKIKLKNFGDYIELFGLKKGKSKITGGKTFSAYSKQKVFAGPYSNLSLLAFTTGQLKVLDPENIKKIQNRKSKFFRNLTGPSAKIGNNYAESFPSLTKLIDTYLKVESIAEVKKIGKKEYTHMDMKVSFKIDKIKNEFPKIEKYLKGIKNLFKIINIYKDLKGNTFLKITMTSKEKNFFRMEFLTAKGMIIPFKKISSPIFKKKYSPFKLKNYKFSVVSNSQFNVHGLKFSNKGMTIGCHYKTDQKKGRLFLKIKKFPKTKVSGRFYSIVPSWLIDVFIPGNLEKYIYDFSKVMEKANDGDGSYINFRWNFKNRKKTIAYIKTSTEFVDNFFIRFGLQITDKKFIPGEKAVKEIDKIIIRLMDNTIKDLKATRN